MNPADDPLFQAGYRQGLADSISGERSQGPTLERRRLFATGTLVLGIGGAVVSALVFSEKHRAIGSVLAFSAAVLGASLAAANIMVDDHPTTPTLRLKV